MFAPPARKANGTRRAMSDNIHLKQRPVDKEFPITAHVGDVNRALWSHGHKGTDFGAIHGLGGMISIPILGASVYSVLPGKVQIAGWHFIEEEESGREIPGPLGLRIWIVSEHDKFGLIRCGYCHLSNTNVKEGDLVYEGQEIGKAGMSGNVTAAHLHLQIEKWPSREILRPYFTETA